MRLLLVRHGESICSVNGIVGGERGCTGLTERGFAQARALRDRFLREGAVFDEVVASTLPRAYQTAETIAEGLGLEVSRDPDLCEMIPGEVDGRPWTEWRELHGFDPTGEPDRPLSPGGESTTVFVDRVQSSLERFAAAHASRSVLACCHGGVIWSSLYRLLGADPRATTATTDFTAITEWRHDGERWNLTRFNDVAHLEGSDLLEPQPTS